MLSIRLLPLLLAVLVLCVAVPLSVRAATSPSAPVAANPTVACYDPIGDPTTGSYSPYDASYYHLYGFQFYYSSAYQVLCAYRVLYANGPRSSTNVYGPWHGNQTYDTTACEGPYNSAFPSASVTWAGAGAGSIATRTNSVTGKQVVTSLTLDDACNPSPISYICMGVCPGLAGYSALQADPTYQVHSFSAPSSTNRTNVQVYTTLNATAAVPLSVNGNQLPNRALSVITAIQLCYGYADITCASAA